MLTNIELKNVIGSIGCWKDDKLYIIDNAKINKDGSYFVNLVIFTVNGESYTIPDEVDEEWLRMNLRRNGVMSNYLYSKPYKSLIGKEELLGVVCEL